jgi:alanine racemase
VDDVRTPSRTWAEIDLSAIRHNVRVLKQRAANTDLMAVVKADAYGHGAVEISRAALEAGADSLAVVTVEEGTQLRDAGIDAPILVFTDLPPDRLSLAVAQDLTVTAHSIQSAKLIAQHPGIKAHLKVNTGMNRWGVEPNEVGAAVKVIGDQLTGVYTHFASADEDEVATKAQISTFDKVLSANSLGDVLVHASNSAATLWHPAARYDCVRPGVSVYGLHPANGDAAEEDLRPALSLKSYVAAVRELSPGEGVSYGLTFRAREPMSAVTVPVGYAEGYRRTGSGEARALIGGVRRPLLGRVTMDACVFGVDSSVAVGDEVVLIGNQGEDSIGANEAGRWAGTINYEITTGINDRRVERRYSNV